MSEIMLKIDNISKQYRLGQIGGTTFREELQRLNAKVFHREDPGRRIGDGAFSGGETFMALDGVSGHFICTKCSANREAGKVVSYSVELKPTITSAS